MGEPSKLFLPWTPLCEYHLLTWSPAGPLPPVPLSEPLSEPSVKVSWCAFSNEVWPSVISWHLICESWTIQLLDFIGKIEAKKFGLMKQPILLKIKKYIACKKFMHLLSRNCKWYKVVCSLLSCTLLQQKAHSTEDIPSSMFYCLVIYGSLSNTHYNVHIYSTELLKKLRHNCRLLH